MVGLIESLLLLVGSDSPIIVSKPKEERVIVGQLTKSATVSVGTNLTTLEGKELKLTCPVKGTPKPKIKWYKDGIELKSGPRITLKDDGILIITKLEADEAGKYTCSAENKHGSDKISTVVKVTGKWSCHFLTRMDFLHSFCFDPTFYGDSNRACNFKF